MIVSVKDGLKLFGIIIVSFCAVFVCTFFANFYVDVLAVADQVTPQTRALYDAQVSMSQFVFAITGGCLSAVALVMLAFYIKLYIDGNAKRFGLLKAMGYSDGRIAAAFWVFGLAVFAGAAAGCIAGYIIMPIIYDVMTIDGIDLTIGFHAWLPFALVLAPTVVFGGLACGYARIKLRGNILAMLKGGRSRSGGKAAVDSGKPFLTEMRRSILRGKKSAVFFVAFSCFCFSSMVQMGLSMKDLSSVTMGAIILSIGVVLSVTAMIMAVTTVVVGNTRSIALMKAFGYSQKERVVAVLAGYIPFAAIGFAVGTVYQYGLLELMVNVVFADVGEIIEYSFDVPMFFVTLAAFIVAYSAAMLFYAKRIESISVKTASAAE